MGTAELTQREIAARAAVQELMAKSALHFKPADVDVLEKRLFPPLPEAADAGAASEPLAPPTPLPSLPPVPEFDCRMLPDALRPWIADAAERARFRPDFAAAASMAALGSVIGRKFGIRLKQRDDWTEHANVWAALVGPPSALKSPALRAALAPFKRLQVQADDVQAAAMARHKADSKEYDLRTAATKKRNIAALAENGNARLEQDPEPPVEPIHRCYWTSNVNEASLGKLLAENPTGLLIERDELSSLLSSLEDDAKTDLRGLLLSGWSGSEGYRFDRILRGRISIPAYALSIVGGVQPGPLARYVRSAYTGERADGLLQRFQLIVWPEAETFEYYDRYPDGTAREAAANLFERTDRLEVRSLGEPPKFGDGPNTVTLSPEASEIFVDWYVAFMRARRSAEASESAPLSAHLGKYPGLLGKLALIVHVADEPQAPRVSKRSLLKALAWLDYLEPHARRVYHAANHPETGAAQLLLARLKRGDLPERFKSWQIANKGWHGLTDAAIVKRACRLLYEHNWLLELDPGGNAVGRPADPVYRVSTLAGGAT